MNDNMVLSSQQKETLFQYRDKPYICTILYTNLG